MNPTDVDIWKTQATPVLVGIVRRVRNAAGVNTSLEDDDNVEYVTQAKVLEPVTLDSPSKCESRIVVDKALDKSVALQGPGEPSSKQALFVEREPAERFALAVRTRLESKVNLSDGMLFNETGVPIGLAGYRLTILNENDGKAETNWNNVNTGDLAVVTSCR